MRTVVALAMVMTAGRASAQVADIEVPTLVLEMPTEGFVASEDGAIDLANIVQSAAKGITTIQEAPAIVTVVTDDEIRDHQFQDILQLADMVPGWQRIGVLHSYFPTVTVRGQIQAVQFLQDGLSMFDTTTNMPTITRQQPMELIKRVEMITGPGGVLWGSNSLLGIMNVITKEAEDVQGIEVGSSIGHGVGDRLMARAYAMAGDSKLLGGKLALFGHGSVETYQGAAFKMPLLLFHQPLPQPNSANTYGPLTETSEQRSLIVNLSGKITLGKLQLRAAFPFGHMVKPMGLSGNPVVKDLPEDARCEDNGVVDPMCLDNLRTSRRSEWDAFDRYVVAEYRSRFADGKAGVTLRAYAQQFVRRLAPLSVLAPSTTIQGGLSFASDATNYRIGSAFDGDADLGRRRSLHRVASRQPRLEHPGSGQRDDLRQSLRPDAVATPLPAYV